MRIENPGLELRSDSSSQHSLPARGISRELLWNGSENVDDHVKCESDASNTISSPHTNFPFFLLLLRCSSTKESGTYADAFGGGTECLLMSGEHVFIWTKGAINTL